MIHPLQQIKDTSPFAPTAVGCLWLLLSFEWWFCLIRTTPWTTNRVLRVSNTINAIGGLSISNVLRYCGVLSQ